MARNWSYINCSAILHTIAAHNCSTSFELYGQANFNEPCYRAEILIKYFLCLIAANRSIVYHPIRHLSGMFNPNHLKLNWLAQQCVGANIDRDILPAMDPVNDRLAAAKPEIMQSAQPCSYLINEIYIHMY